MTESQALEVLMFAAANWINQPTDSVVRAVWARALSGIELQDGIAAIEAIASKRRADGASPPPTPYTIAIEAKGIEHRHLSATIAKRRRLDAPPVSEEERNAVRNGIRELGERLFGAMAMNRGTGAVEISGHRAAVDHGTAKQIWSQGT